MKVHTKLGRVAREHCEVTMIGLFEGDTDLAQDLKELPKLLADQIKPLIRSREFEGKHQQLSLIHSKAGTPAKRILIVGLGKRKDCSLEKIRQATSKAAQYIRSLGLDQFCAPLLMKNLERISPAAIAQAMVEGALLGLYQFTLYKTEPRDSTKPIKKLTLLEEDPRRLKEIRKAVDLGRILAEAANMARDLGNSPSNDMTPSHLAEVSQAMSEELNLECEVLERSEMETLGMGGLLGVSRGSQEPAKLIILKYHGRHHAEKPIALVGKTITFDTGGISIKPSEKMEQMKYDMMGGATVLCAIRAAAQLKLPINVVGFLPATENMPSGTAMKPGDVIKTLSGKTVEVINTDAEGRLILADALTYATRYRPSAIVDLATLTGACTVALGHHAIGLLGNNTALLEAIKNAAQATGERVWELPLWEDYYDQIKSDIADVKNVGGRAGGTITAAAFLSKFVGNYPWAHLDIASTAWADEARPYIPKGATGVGVRLMVQFLMESTIHHVLKPPARPKAKARGRRV